MKQAAARDITVIVPAYNEERNLASAIDSVNHALCRYPGGYTILIINDGSSDRTEAVAQKIARRDNRVRVIVHRKNRGLGYTFRHALPHVKTRYVTVFPADNDMSAASLTRLVEGEKTAELVTGYMSNTGNRSRGRQILSRAYIVGMNTLFHLHLRYYNGPFVCDTARLRAVSLRGNGLDILAEAKIRMIRAGCSVKEIPFEHIGRKHGTSKAVTLKSIIQTIRTTGLLVRDLYWRKSP